MTDAEEVQEVLADCMHAEHFRSKSVWCDTPATNLKIVNMWPEVTCPSCLYAGLAARGSSFSRDSFWYGIFKRLNLPLPPGDSTCHLKP